LSEQLIAGLGIDISSNKVWIVTGRLSSKGLEIYQVLSTNNHQLAKELTSTHYVAVGVNFPMSFPIDFVRFCAQKAKNRFFQSWQEFVEHTFSVSLEQMLELAKEFKKEPLRLTDQQHKITATSSLHRENPAMLPVVYHNMRTLAALDPQRFSIMPFQSPQDGLCTLLEVCADTTLSALKIASKYKITKDQIKARTPESRQQILESLLELKETRKISCKDHPKLFISPSVFIDCGNSDYVMDALIACYTASIWVLAPQLFDDPFDSNNEDVLLEGWVYAPQKEST
jgi:hypothetical protein